MKKEMLTLKELKASKDAVFVSTFYTKEIGFSKAIKEAITCAKQKPSIILVFDTIKEWLINEAILLPSNTIVVMDGVIIKQQNLTFDNVFRGDNLTFDPAKPNGYPLEVALLENVKILGFNGAQIIGPDENFKIINPAISENEEQEAVGDFYGFRTLQISFSNANQIEVSGLKFSQTRGWCISLDKCVDFEIHDLEIFSEVKNGDGVDIRHGCNNGQVYNISGSTSDDMVALTSMPIVKDFPTGKIMFPIEPGSLLLDGVTPEELGIHTVTVKNIKKEGKYHAVIVLSTKGNLNQNIIIEDVEEVTARTRDALVKVYTAYSGGYAPNSISGIQISNIKGIGDYIITSGTGENQQITKTGVVYCNCKIDNSTIDDVTAKEENNAVWLKYGQGISISDVNTNQIEIINP